jgi:hypothetical protein
MTAGRILAWLRGGRGGLFVLAAGVGVGAGLSAVVFRYLVYFFTWLATGHTQFGQQGRVGSTHLPWLGLGFLVLIPVIGGLLYGPLIYRFAREARGHGVPEVMMAVADHGGRIRPQVSLVKAVASALCMGAGGSVGREGPIVQIGSALASSLGQWAKIPESRLRILVALARLPAGRGHRRRRFPGRGHQAGYGPLAVRKRARRGGARLQLPVGRPGPGVEARRPGQPARTGERGPRERVVSAG